MLDKWFSKKGQQRFPKENFTITKAEVQGMPAIAMVNLAYKNYAFSTEYPCHVEAEITLQEKTEEGLSTPSEASVLNDAEDRLMEALQKAGATVHFIARQTWNGKRIIDCYVDRRDVAEAVFASCIQGDVFKRPCTYKLDDDPAWSTAKAFLKHF